MASARIGTGLDNFLFFYMVAQRATSGKIGICGLPLAYRSVRSRFYTDFYISDHRRSNVRKNEF